MSILKKFISAIITGSILLGVSATAFACDEAAATPKTSYSVEFENSILDGAMRLSEETTIEGDRIITVTTYRAKDGMIVTDTLDRSAVVAHSKNGSNTIARTLDLDRYGAITIRASFRWYTDEDAGIMGIGYVKCTRMTASWSAPTGYTCDVWETDYEDEYQSFGKAWAQVKYKIYETSAPIYEVKGTFKITCSDTGDISDNG